MTATLLAEILNSVLQLNINYQTDTALLGAIAELDSIAVLAIIAALEDQLGIVVNDDELSAEIFETFGDLLTYITGKIKHPPLT